MRSTESDWEHLALDHLAEIGWLPLEGRAIAPGVATAVGHPGYSPSGEPLPQRESWAELTIPSRMRAALRRLNPDVPRDYLEQALVEVLRPTSQDAITENKRIHDVLVDGYRITYTEDGRQQTPSIRLVSAREDENEWLAVNQVRVVQGDVERRFDIVLYLNGMPVVVMELKNAGSARADVAAAHAQLTTYVRELPMVFRFCVLTLVSDGIVAKYGTPFTPLNHYAPWNVDDDGRTVGPSGAAGGVAGTALGITDDVTEGEVTAATPLEVSLDGLFNPQRFVQLLRGFVAFDEGEDGLAKRVAKPHQYFAVTKAVGATVQAVETDGRAGVVWHTQGSGKSMEMELYAAHVARHPKLLNPTIVVVTDRTELDGQLYGTFARSQLLTEEPRQIKRRAELRDELAARTTGGIYFTTLQKFGLTAEEKGRGAKHPVLSERRNVILVVDEAHRSHYDDLDGYAWHLKNALPNATLIAFTGTPISTADRNTEQVFGSVIDTYDLTRAVEDGATVPVYFESRLVKVAFAEDLDAEALDAAADEVTVGLDDAERARIEKTVAVVNAVYGAPARLRELATDVVAHWEARREAMGELVRSTSRKPSAAEPAPGKALIVGATRDICARLYDEIVALRPDWHADDLYAGRIKVVYSGTPADQPPVADHVRRDSENAVVKQRLKDPDDELEVVIVKDMMLTGYDSPPLHTLYLDRPMRGALLMQTLARVNRTFRGKNAGLLVASAPIAENLRAALAEYTARDQGARPVGRTVEDAADVARELVEQLRSLLEPSRWRERLAAAQRAGSGRAYLDTLWATADWLRSPHTPGNRPTDEGDETREGEFRRRAAALSRAWAIAGRTDELADVADEARFYEDVRVSVGKLDAEARQASGEPVPDDVQRLLNQLMATAVTSGEVLDVYAAAGLPHPRLDQLDDEFLAKAQGAPNPQLAIEALRALVTQESRRLTQGNLARQQMFSERLQAVMTKYVNSNLTSAEVIAELVELAREVAEEATRGERFDPPISRDELAFYDAVATNDSAVEVLGDGVLAQIARDLVAVVRRDMKTDWTVRDDVRAKLRSSIKRLLIRHGYPPDKQPEAIVLVLQQMESMAPRYAA
ncbi:type I restriction endonuclease subunit R [Cellulosimicrobium arenosum]|uniref:Type I restriction enzyme endonuclease subunit n=1 Tax=Cellulosimicrobium arenosum TaxID=2708133 RepID=A0A927G8A5_9MICO|nr:type I restriction endonuclease subunit R [Cellulosimicrobium arenosum]MBD8078165.1 type I restriction endonuclease subunit R [Cellulosimicrobium arenosum]